MGVEGTFQLSEKINMPQQSGQSLFLGSFKHGHFKLSPATYSIQHGKPPSSRSKQYLLLNIQNSLPVKQQSLVSSGSQQSLSSKSSSTNDLQLKSDYSTTSAVRSVSFTAVAFSKQLPQFAAIDQRGNLYLFDLESGKFELLARIGISGTALEFGRFRSHEIYVGLSDTSIQSYNTISQQVPMKLNGHGKSFPCLHLSSHPKKPYLLSAASNSIIMWETNDWKRKRVLSGVKGLTVIQGLFDPTGDMIVALFDDATIVMWNLDTFSVTWKIDLKDSFDRAGVPVDFSRSKTPMAFNYDSTIMAVSVASVSNNIYIWDVGSKSLSHQVSIGDSVNIKQLQFLGKTCNLGLLNEIGHFVVIDAFSAQEIKTAQHRLGLTSEFVTSQDGEYLVSISQHCHIIQIYDCDRVINEKVAAKTVKLSGSQEELFNEEPDHGHALPEKMDYENLVPAPLHQSTSTKELKMIESASTSPALNFNRLSHYLMHFGEFPEKYRMLIWRFLLQVPENRDAFESLRKRGLHSNYKMFRKKYPMKSERISRSMEIVMSAMAHWSSIFEDADMVPCLVFPFVKVYKNDTFACFEVLVSILNNWCEKWWEFYPNPPVQALDIIEDLLQHHDKGLLQFFRRNQISSQIYAWPLLSSFFSDVLCQKDWFVAWDHILLNEIDFIFYFTVAFLKSMRGQIFQINRSSDLKSFSQQNAACDIKKVVQLAYLVAETTPSQLKPRVPKFKSLVKGHYPVFNKYPEHIVNYQKKLRERIKLEEEELIKKKIISAELAKYTETLQQDRKTWAHAEERKTKMLETWWNSLIDQESKHYDNQIKESVFEHENRLGVLQGMDQAEHDIQSVKEREEFNRSNLMNNLVKKTREFDEKTDELHQLDSGLDHLENAMDARLRRLNVSRKEFGNVEDNKVAFKLKKMAQGGGLDE